MPRTAISIALLLFIAENAFGATNYVTTNGNGSGVSWDEPASLSNALAIANNGDQIWIAEGTYTNDRDGTSSFVITTNY